MNRDPDDLYTVVDRNLHLSGVRKRACVCVFTSFLNASKITSGRIPELSSLLPPRQSTAGHSRFRGDTNSLHSSGRSKTPRGADSSMGVVNNLYGERAG